MDRKTYEEMMRRFIDSMEEKDNDNSREEITEQKQMEPYVVSAKRLRDAYNEFNTIQTLKIGDIVVWKDRLKNKRIPEYGQPAIVIDVLDEPMYDEESPISSQYFREPLDIKLGFIDEDGDFVMYMYDSRRFVFGGDH